MKKSDDDSYKFIPHNFVKTKSLPWSVCRGCGLVTLNNKFTEWCETKGCDHLYHPGYKRAMIKYTKLFDG